MASLEKRVKHLFPGKGRCLIESALVFARRRNEWLTQRDLIDYVGRDFAKSTVRNAFRRLSSPMEMLNNSSYIEVISVTGSGRGRPIIRGKMSEAALVKIFDIATPLKHPPPVYHTALDKIGRIELQPLSFEKLASRNIKQISYLAPQDILKLTEKKIGTKETDRQLNRLIKEDKAKEIKVSRTRRWGRPPHHQYLISNEDLERLLEDTNEGCNSVDAILSRSTDDDLIRLEAASLVPCPSCHNLTHKSDLVHIHGARSNSCLTEYMHAALNATTLERQNDGSYKETVKDIAELSALGSTRDKCRENLFDTINNWIRNRQKERLDLPIVGCH